MQRTQVLFFAASKQGRLHFTRKLCSDPIVKIANGTFYRQHPASKEASGLDTVSNPPLFPNLNFELPSSTVPNQHWAILSPSSDIRTAFLQVIRGQLLCFPPTARTYPYLLSPEETQNNPRLRFPESAIEYVGFDAERKAFGGAYLSARYESLKEETDFTLQRYLTGIVTLNPGEEELRAKRKDENLVKSVMRDLELERFLEKPVAMLSNGQSRRARIGKALLTQPLVLCLDAPFIGLDPIVTKHISNVLYRLAEANTPRIVFSLRPQDMIPQWITHLVYVGEDGKVDTLGPKEEVLEYLRRQYHAAEASGKQTDFLDPRLVELHKVGRHLFENESSDPKTTKAADSPIGSAVLSRDGYQKVDRSSIAIGEPVVEMEGVRIAYGPNSVLGDWQQDVNGITKNGLHMTIRRGQRWGVFGANGSGKTTFLSLVTSDHPQTYSKPVKLFQRSRLPEPGQTGISIFELQSRMGHASPEIHAFFPKYLSVKRALESAWSDTPITAPRLNEESSKRVDACLKWFEDELNPHKNASRHSDGGSDWASITLFGELSYSAQRVLLFLRCIIRNPDIVILDEAFSGMDDLARDKCLLFLSHGQSMSLQYTSTGPRPVESELAQKQQIAMPGLQPHQALLCVSHNKQEVPGCIRDWICLPEPGTGPPKFGKWQGPVELDEARWDAVWGETSA